MNLDELRSVQAKERRKDSLQHLRDAFYDDVAAYVGDLRAARDRRADQVAKPFSDDDVRRMSDELETAEEVAEALYERRVGKVVKLASFAAADMPVETEGMTTQERALFDDLVERIETNKAAVLDVLAGEEPPGETSSATATETPSTTPAQTEPRADPAPTTEDEPASSANDDPRSGTIPESADAPAETNVLAGAMGGDPDRRAEVDDADGSADDATGGSVDDVPPDVAGDVSPDVAADVTSDTAGESPANGESPTDGAAPDDKGSEPTPVDPEPAPPGAPHATESESPTESASDADAVADGSGSTAASDPGVNGAGPTERNGEPTADPGADRQTVRITRDVGSILGVDEREYELASEDVVALPAENVEPLVQRDAAERVD